MAPLIDVTGLTKAYGRKRGIIDVSFEVIEGEVFGFLGPNGAGKTTTMRLLMALLCPNAGSASHRGPGLLAAVGGRQARGGVSSGRARARSQPHGRPDPRLLRQPARRRRSRVSRTPHRPPRSRPDAPVPPLLARQQTEGRADSGLHASPAPADPRRADERSRSAEPARVRPDGGRGARRRTHRVPVIAHPLGGGIGLRSRRHHSRGAARSGRRRGRAEGHQAARGGPDLRGTARVRRVPRRWRASSASRRCPTAARSDLSCTATSTRSSRLAARYPLTRFVSHEPSLEDVFLRFYQDAGPVDGREEAAGVAP